MGDVLSIEALAAVAAVTLLAALLVGLFPRMPVPQVVLLLVGGIVIAPDALGSGHRRMCGCWPMSGWDSSSCWSATRSTCGCSARTPGAGRLGGLPGTGHGGGERAGGRRDGPGLSGGRAGPDHHRTRDSATGPPGGGDLHEAAGRAEDFPDNPVGRVSWRRHRVPRPPGASLRRRGQERRHLTRRPVRCRASTSPLQRGYPVLIRRGAPQRGVRGIGTQGAASGTRGRRSGGGADHWAGTHT